MYVCMYNFGHVVHRYRPILVCSKCKNLNFIFRQVIEITAQLQQVFEMCKVAISPDQF